MKGWWWRCLSALLAAICGLAFGWFAGVGVARAENGRTAASTPARAAACAREAQTWAENHASRRFQPSSASFLR